MKLSLSESTPIRVARDEEDFNIPSTPRLLEIQRVPVKKQAVMAAKLVIVFVVLLLYSVSGSKAGAKQPPCIDDLLLYSSVKVEELNQEMNKPDSFLSRFLLISSSALVDLGAFTSMYGTATSPQPLRWMWTILFFFLVRAILQKLFLFTQPRGSVMNDPGFPSFTVPYGIFSDFYFSGHCGFLTISALANYDFGFKKIAFINLLSLPYLVFVLTVHRLHYSIDIIIGILAAIYMFAAAGMNAEKIDEFFGTYTRKYILRQKWFAEV